MLLVGKLCLLFAEPPLVLLCLPACLPSHASLTHTNIGHTRQVLMSVDKDMAGNISTHELMDVGYVPLTRPSELEDGQLL